MTSARNESGRMGFPTAYPPNKFAAMIAMVNAPGDTGHPSIATIHRG